jgi:hypothetical protein
MTEKSFELEFVNETVASRVLGFAVNTLRGWRLSGDGPPYYKVGTSGRAAVRYRLDECRDWMHQHRRVHSSQQ